MISFTINNIVNQKCYFLLDARDARDIRICIFIAKYSLKSIINRLSTFTFSTMMQNFLSIFLIILFNYTLHHLSDYFLF